jgi:hypothetical protein
MQDKIIREVRRVREELARRNDYDVHKIVEDIRARAAQRKAAERVERRKRASVKKSA